MSRQRCAPSWLPRPRGDGPQAELLGTTSQEAPPPTRGWTQADEAVVGGDPGSPAHAGMDLCRSRWRTHTPRLPRPRGDGPTPYQSDGIVFGAPPPTRGWTAGGDGAAPGRAGSPAHAGMDPRWSRCPSAGSRLPRPRGDGPQVVMAQLQAAQAPPPTRGWTSRGRGPDHGDAGSPAHAGMDPARETGARSRGWLPRPRGDGPIAPRGERAPSTAPPPTRGWTVLLDELRRGADGSPRPRGDGPLLFAAADLPILAPPPTRGWTRVEYVLRARQAGSPAHAGMDPSGIRTPGPTGRLPRPRGDGPPP